MSEQYEEQFFQGTVKTDLLFFPSYNSKYEARLDTRPRVLRFFGMSCAFQHKKHASFAPLSIGFI